MVRQVVWSPGALEDLAEIRTYLEHRSPGNAERVVNRIAEAAEAISDFPLGGRIIPEFAARHVGARSSGRDGRMAPQGPNKRMGGRKAVYRGSRVTHSVQRGGGYPHVP